MFPGFILSAVLSAVSILNKPLLPRGASVRIAGGGQGKNLNTMGGVQNLNKPKLVEVKCDKCERYLIDAPEDSATYCPYCKRIVQDVIDQKGGD